MLVEIRRQGSGLESGHEQFLADRVRRVLRHFRNRVHMVVAFVSETKSSHGRILKCCRMLVHMKAEDSVLVQHFDKTLVSAIVGASDLLAATMDRHLRTEKQ